MSRFTPGQNLFEKPKSVSFTWPSFDSVVGMSGVGRFEVEVVDEVEVDGGAGGKKTTFSGLRSRWATWSLWQYDTAVRIWVKYTRASGSGRPPVREPCN